ncbi:flagellar operon protein TIGR03826 [Anaerobranca californiensis DSM 14826]|jgi:flagellar operon protein (TIGR03826 family)|uniref:Flagellar operon protein TIGR03826 n=1 Tax=Anaerobranca californiensis DSM 14826 TaxID=1120989 RepID=A0A1M6Q265_9FIRM|nr:TIGR03826 family flagellar region protein [Anaerobranca californiensis]SHK14294.1 flagellar operon protein TIGR03826 [Anaerobranca californiensis DSM 14826]
MDIRNCPKCGKLFQRLRRDICPTCAQQEDKEYEIVRDYIYDNPKSDVQTVSEETGVPVETILKFLRENRLINVSEALVLDCENCGAPISSGRFCKECGEKLEKEFSSLTKKEKEDTPKDNQKASFHFMRDRLYKKDR